MSCEPEVVVHKRSEKDELLVFACDGIWDVWKDMEAMRTTLNEMIVSHYLLFGENGIDGIGKLRRSVRCVGCFPRSVFAAR